MTKKELSQAVAMALSGKGNFDNIDIFDGFGLSSFKTVSCTLNDLAGLVKWQAIQFNGSVDGKALDEIYKAKQKITIV